MKTRNAYSAPPDPIYKAGKKKERLTKCILMLEGVQADIRDGLFDDGKRIGTLNAISEILPVLKGYRKYMDQV